LFFIEPPFSIVFKVFIEENKNVDMCQEKGILCRTLKFSEPPKYNLYALHRIPEKYTTVFKLESKF